LGMQDNHSTAGFPTQTHLDMSQFYIDYLRSHPKRPSASGVWPPPGPAITLSSQTGAGAHEVADRLATILQNQEPPGHAPWTVFDRQLVEIALEEHHLPARLAKLIPEDRRSYLNDVIDVIIGLRPPSWEVIPKIVQSVRHLADTGNVILVGRGAAIITGGMANVFHVRLIASLPERVARVQKLENFSEHEAAKFIAASDNRRGRYVRAHFHKRIDDDLQYHLVVNTVLVPPPKAAELIAAASRKCFDNRTPGLEQKTAA